MSCPKCKKFTKVLNKLEGGYYLNYCKKCELIYSNHYYHGMDMDGEMQPHKSNIMVGSPIWNKLTNNVELPRGECVDYRNFP